MTQYLVDRYYPFQQHDAAWLIGRKSALLAHEMGLGKTIISIRGMNLLCAKQILIICKASLKINWERELHTWLENKKLKIQILSGTKDRLRADTDIVIVNYDLLAISQWIYVQVSRRTYDVGVFDEAHYLKGRTTKRTKAILLRNGIASKCAYKWFLTGTPVLNRPEELYPILKAAAPEVIHPYTSFDAFARRFCGAWWDGFQLVSNGASHTDELNKRLTKNFMLRRLKKDVLLQLPAKTYQLVTVPPANIKIAELAAKEFTWGKHEAKKVAGVTSADHIAIIRHEIGLSKVDQTVAHIDDLLMENDKLVIFAYHRSVIKALHEKLEHYGAIFVDGSVSSENRQSAVDIFQNSKKTRIFIGQFQAAGDGITLTVANTVVFVESSWTPAEIEQAADRTHRIGQKKAVLVQFLVIENSFEDYMLRTLIDKKQTIKEIVDGNNK